MESRKLRELREERRSLGAGSGGRRRAQIDGGCRHTKSSSAEGPGGAARYSTKQDPLCDAVFCVASTARVVLLPRAV